MRQPLVEPASDQEFLRKVGIKPDVGNRPTAPRLFILAVALLLALGTSLLAAFFHAGSIGAGGNLESGVTQCPMSPDPEKGRAPQ